MKRTYEELTHDVVMRDHWLEELRAENEKLAAALVAKDAALERCTKFTQEDYDALELKPHADLVRKIKAEAVREAAAMLGGEGEQELLRKIAPMFERGEV